MSACCIKCFVFVEESLLCGCSLHCFCPFQLLNPGTVALRFIGVFQNGFGAPAESRKQSRFSRKQNSNSHSLPKAARCKAQGTASGVSGPSGRGHSCAFLVVCCGMCQQGLGFGGPPSRTQCSKLCGGGKIKRFRDVAIPRSIKHVRYVSFKEPNCSFSGM